MNKMKGGSKRSRWAWNHINLPEPVPHTSDCVPRVSAGMTFSLFSFVLWWISHTRGEDVWTKQRCSFVGRDLWFLLRMDKAGSQVWSPILFTNDNRARLFLFFYSFFLIRNTIHYTTMYSYIFVEICRIEILRTH